MLYTRILRQHTSAYASYVSIRQQPPHTLRYVVHQDLKRISKARVLVVALKRCGLVYRRRTKAREKRRPAYVSIRQHTSAEGIRQHTSAYVSREATTWSAGVPDYLRALALTMIWRIRRHEHADLVAPPSPQDIPSCICQHTSACVSKRIS